MTTILSDPISPTRLSQLRLGGLYHLTGQGEDTELLPAQIFRLESMSSGMEGGTTILVGTLWWKVWVLGRAYSGTIHPHQIALHHVSIGPGSQLSSRHEFHFERIHLNDVPRILGNGRVYEDFLRDQGLLPRGC